MDANVLVALIVSDHVHHDAAENWFAGVDDSFATCPITQGSLVRLLMRGGQSAEDAHAVVAALTGNSRHEFWPDSVSFTDFALRGVIGHRQVTDAYLAQLVRHPRHLRPRPCRTAPRRRRTGARRVVIERH